MISLARPAIETFTDRKWSIPDYPDLERIAKTYDNLKQSSISTYEYLIYLRHHGFPSPLLDWSLSPNVAAYFAFADAKTDRIAIYVYWEFTGQGKVSSSNAPQVLSYGPYQSSHPRHFLQQSVYTLCARFEHDQWRCAPHREVLGEYGGDQDQLWKLTLPTSERLNVLSRLDSYNLNAFSLFQSEEALLRTIAVREIDVKRRS